MDLPHTIYDHARALPVHLQREALDFITYLEHRHRVAPPAQSPLTTEAFIQQFAGSIGPDFPSEIGTDGLADDAHRDTLE
ncbi:hypothetical protein ACVBEH_10070 [Roseateles sp. GG27B]